ncbi:uncharacterized protein BX663DRAFT_490429 [Cokeromyces recurvatus]|uniref:uncharacterized protein n=1 Tax=Cokeromyces recurvatus TaxID=90255 RepID=UPI00221FD006|nr:uncharacterized protein BX663DRAFT_490429 [Cokeromyces recurvatus]KAI7897922.1 hypothetical protein BX663DRAFT_490429 [Cokeromyces recurvatus]
MANRWRNLPLRPLIVRIMEVHQATLEINIIAGPMPYALHSNEIDISGNSHERETKWLDCSSSFDERLQLSGIMYQSQLPNELNLEPVVFTNKISNMMQQWKITVFHQTRNESYILSKKQPEADYTVQNKLVVERLNLKERYQHFWKKTVAELLRL